MSGYERASDKGTTRETVTYWAELWRSMPKNSHGESLVSPKFDTEGGATEWVRRHKDDYEEVAMWKRLSHAHGDYHDQSMMATEDVPIPDPERLHEIVAKLKNNLL